MTREWRINVLVRLFLPSIKPLLSRIGKKAKSSVLYLALPWVHLQGWDDNGFPCAFYYSNQLFLLRLWHAALIDRLLKVIQKGLPLLGSDHKMPMGITHGTPAVVLWTTCCPADHFGHKVLEPCWRYAMVGFIHARIGIQSWIDHDSVNEIIDDSSDVIHPTEPIIERYLFWALHSQPPCLLRMHTCLSPENIRTTL